MNTKTLLGVSFATVFAVVMMTNPAFAIPPQLIIESVDQESGVDCDITVGAPPGTAQRMHDILVYVCLTAPLGTDGQTAWLAAIHPSFNDDPEENPGNKKIHAHTVTLDASNCVASITTMPEVSVSGKTITIPTTGTTTGWAVVGYDIGSDGSICPTAVYSGTGDL